jgi:iron complex outermembrane receptor protein
VSEGSKTGGFNGRAGSVAEFNRFSPEKVWTYEAGLRSEWLDRRLRFNATGYFSAYTDFQILLNSSVTDPATGNPVPFSFVGNIPRASIRGAELTLAGLPTPGLRLEAALGITPLPHQQQLTARVDYIHKSAIQYDYANSPLVEQRPFGLVNARFTWLTPCPSLTLYAFGTNLTDVHYAIGGLDDGAGGSLGEVIKLMGRPREWGLGAQLRF